MPTAAQLDRLIEPVTDIYSGIEDELLINIAQRFPFDVAIEDVDDWRFEKMNELRALERENAKTVARNAGLVAAEMKVLLEGAGYDTLERDDHIYKAALAKGVLSGGAGPARSSVRMRQILTSSLSDATQYLNMVNTTALEASRVDFLTILNRAYLETSTGLSDYNTAIRNAVRDLSDKGITGATYISARGRVTRNQIDVAVRRAVLTSTSQTTGKMQLARAQEWGTNLVEVSSHVGARPSHAVWQGGVYSLAGGSVKYPNLVDATGYGSIDGFKGVNCAHEMYPYFPGLPRQGYRPDEDENRKIYEQSQEQRRLEREIRAEKRRMMAADAQGDKEAFAIYSQHLKQKEDKLEAFMASTGRRQRPRVQVAGFGRSVSQKSVWANRNQLQSPKGPSSISVRSISVPRQTIINSNPGLNKAQISSLMKAQKEVLSYGLKTGKESVIAIDLRTGKTIAKNNSQSRSSVAIDMKDVIRSPKDSVIIVHNHPKNSSFSAQDLNIMNKYPSIRSISVQAHDGTVYTAEIGTGVRLPAASSFATLDAEYDALYTMYSAGKTPWKEVSHNVIKDICSSHGWTYRRDGQ